MKDAIERRDEAIDLIEKYGYSRGESAKTWVIDQVLQTLLGSEYDAWVRDFELKNGDEPGRTWDTGSKP